MEKNMKKNVNIYIYICLCVCNWITLQSVHLKLTQNCKWTTPHLKRASLVAQMVKRLPTMRETLVRSLGREDPLEKEMATHSSTLAWKIPWMEEPGRQQSMGSQRVGHDWETSLHFTSLQVVCDWRNWFTSSSPQNFVGLFFKWGKQRR